MIILRQKEHSKDFVLDGRYHSRKPDRELTKITKDLNVSVSSYTDVIGDKGEMKFMDVWLNEDPSKFFWLGNFDSLLNNDSGWHGWTIHFRTYQDNAKREYTGKSEITEEQKKRLFEATSRIIPQGETLSSYGTISPGGVHGLERFGSLGFNRVGTAYPLDCYNRNKKIAVPIWKKI